MKILLKYLDGKMMMKKTVYLFTALALCFSMMLNAKEKSSSKEKAIMSKVNTLLSKMTLEEKIGQMTQITIATVSKQRGTVNQKFIMDHNKLKQAILDYHVGSILNVYDVAIDVDFWHEIITEIQDVATKETRLKIPILYGIDAIHGATYTTGATLFPQAINMAATFNTELVRKEGEITSLEVRASGIPWNFFPVLDLGRQPLWARLWETYATLTKNFVPFSTPSLF